MKILIADDEEINLQIIKECLEEESLETLTALDGKQAWEMLEHHPDIAVILLDRMMPVMDGMQFLSKIKHHEEFAHIPVIMQTAAADMKSVIEGIKAGVYYYLTKPYKKPMLTAIVQSALQNRRQFFDLSKASSNYQHVLSGMQSSSFFFRTPEEAQNLAWLLSQAYPEPQRVILGLSEVLLNAIEHGNLGVGFETKSQIILDGSLKKEITRRLSLPENKNKYAKATFLRTGNAITLSVLDCGQGFNWHNFLDLQPERATHPNGRGIMMARMLSFDSIEYKGSGNEVTCTVSLTPAQAIGSDRIASVA